MQKEKLFVLFHDHKFDDGYKDIKEIGIFSSYKEAKKMQEKYLHLEGFKEQPEGFYIIKYELDSVNQNILEKVFAKSKM